MNKSRELKHGDRVSALGITCTIADVLYQDHFGDRPDAPGSDCWGYDVEFTDTHGAYHHWKQNQDGGSAFRWNGRTWAAIVPEDPPASPVSGTGVQILRRFRNDFGFTAWIEQWPEAYGNQVRLKIFNQYDYKIWESHYDGHDTISRARTDLITRAAGVWTECD